MESKELEIVARARREAEQVYARLAPQRREFQRMAPQLLEMQRALRSAHALFAGLEQWSQQVLAMQEGLDRLAKSSLVLSTPALLKLNRIAGQAPVANIALSTPALIATSGVTAPVYVPEDDPIALRKQLADKDAEIAELKAELRTYRLAEAFGSGQEHEAFGFSEN